jgi:hypothetical protein
MAICLQFEYMLFARLHVASLRLGHSMVGTACQVQAAEAVEHLAFNFAICSLSSGHNKASNCRRPWFPGVCYTASYWHRTKMRANSVTPSIPFKALPQQTVEITHSIFETKLCRLAAAGILE